MINLKPFVNKGEESWWSCHKTYYSTKELHTLNNAIFALFLAHIEKQTVTKRTSTFASIINAVFSTLEMKLES